MTVIEATVIKSDGHTWWTCPDCGRKLGEIRGDRVVITAGQRHLVIFLTNDQVQRCPAPACGQESRLSVRQVA